MAGMYLMHFVVARSYLILLSCYILVVIKLRLDKDAGMVFVHVGCVRSFI